METRSLFARAVILSILLFVSSFDILANQKEWYLEARGGLDIYQTGIYHKADYANKEIWGLTVGMGLREDVSLNLNYLYRHDVHEGDSDRLFPDYYYGGYYLVHVTELGGATIRELTLGTPLHLKRPGKGFYFGISAGLARENYSRLVKCLYQPDDSY